MEEENKTLKLKYQIDDQVIVYESKSFIDGEVGQVVDFDNKWSDKKPTYLVCPLKEIGKIERMMYESGSQALPLNDLFNVSRWVKQDNLKKINFRKPKWYKKYKYIIINTLISLSGMAYVYFNGMSNG